MIARLPRAIGVPAAVHAPHRPARGVSCLALALCDGGGRVAG